LVQKFGQLQLFQLYPHRNAWANSHLLGQPHTFLVSTRPQIEHAYLQCQSILVCNNRCTKDNLTSFSLGRQVQPVARGDRFALSVWFTAAVLSPPQSFTLTKPCNMPY
jgi:hypothetical protein